MAEDQIIRATWHPAEDRRLVRGDVRARIRDAQAAALHFHRERMREMRESVAAPQQRTPPIVRRDFAAQTLATMMNGRRTLCAVRQMRHVTSGADVNSVIC